jgi:hypothetical protein
LKLGIDAIVDVIRQTCCKSRDQLGRGIISLDSGSTSGETICVTLTGSRRHSVVAVNNVGTRFVKRTFGAQILARIWDAFLDTKHTLIADATNSLREKSLSSSCGCFGTACNLARGVAVIKLAVNSCGAVESRDAGCIIAASFDNFSASVTAIRSVRVVVITPTIARGARALLDSQECSQGNSVQCNEWTALLESLISQRARRKIATTGSATVATVTITIAIVQASVASESLKACGILHALVNRSLAEVKLSAVLIGLASLAIVSAFDIAVLGVAVVPSILVRLAILISDAYLHTLCHGQKELALNGTIGENGGAT